MASKLTFTKRELLKIHVALDAMRHECLKAGYATTIEFDMLFDKVVSALTI